MKRSSILLSSVLIALLSGCGDTGNAEKDESPSVEVVDAKVNAAPVATFDTFSISRAAKYDGQLTATDADGDTLKYIIVTQPQHGTVVLHDNGCFTYTSDEGYVGTDTFSYKASDDVSTCAVKTVTVNVKAPTTTVPSAPSNLQVKALSTTKLELTWKDNASNEEGFAIYKDGKLVATTKANETRKVLCCGLEAGKTYDFEVKAKNEAGLSSPATAQGTTKDVTTPPNAPTELKAKAVDKTSLRLEWKDNADNESGYEIYQDGVKIKTISSGCQCTVITGLTEGTEYSFEVKAINKIGSASSNSLSIKTAGGIVTPPVNHAPTAKAGTDVSITAGESVTLNASASSDSDGDITSYEWKEGATVLSTNASFTKADFTVGTHTITLTVTDNDGATATDTVVVTVNAAANHTPVATAQNVNTNEDTAKTITLTGTDADGDNLTYTISTQPSHGTLSGTAPNVTYTPNANYFGNDSFSFKVKDGTVESTPATVSITVADINDAPTAKAGADQSIKVGDNATLNASASSDSDGTITSYEWKEGATVLSTNASFTKADFTVGTHTITLTVTDNDGATATDTVVVTVNAAANECQATLETEQNFTDTYVSSAHEDRPWEKNLTEEVTVDDIAAEFNAARATDSTITTNLVMPSQAEWDSYSDSQKALYLLKSERCARGIRPFEGIDTNVVTSPAQYYADYLKDNNVWGHEEDGKTPWERLEEKANVIVNTNADFYSYAENLAFVAYGSSASYPTIHEPVAMAVYSWIYDDKDDTQGSYGHRLFALSTGLVENFGEDNKEGLIGVGVSTIEYEDGGFYWTKVYTVLNGFDPNANWEDGANIIKE